MEPSSNPIIPIFQMGDEAQGGQETCPRSHSRGEAELGLRPGLPGSQRPRGQTKRACLLETSPAPTSSAGTVTPVDPKPEPLVSLSHQPSACLRPGRQHCGRSQAPPILTLNQPPPPLQRGLSRKGFWSCCVHTSRETLWCLLCPQD